MGLSYSQAHRRMTGASVWSLEDLARVGALLGERLDQVVSLAETASVRAVAHLGAATFDCRLWIGAPVPQPHATQVVAVHRANAWVVVIAGDAPSEAAHAIDRLEAEPSTSVRKTIAVLDDDQDLTNSICAHFGGSAYDARPFYKTADLLSSAKAQRYDAYVIDWIVGETSTLKLIADLREQDAACPIVVLTAQVLSGVVDEEDIAQAVKKHDLVFSEKPVRMSILSATLARAFEAARPRPT
jgi:ActR/RegA family two-component response regulator